MSSQTNSKHITPFHTVSLFSQLTTDASMQTMKVKTLPHHNRMLSQNAQKAMNQTFTKRSHSVVTRNVGQMDPYTE